MQKSKPIKLEKTKTTIQVFGKGASIRPIGKVTVLLEGNEMFFTESIYVMPNDSFENILSKDASVSLGFIKIFNEVQPEKQVFTTHTTEENHVASLESLLKKYKNVGDGLLKNYEHKLHVNSPPSCTKITALPSQPQRKYKQ